QRGVDHQVHRQAAVGHDRRIALFAPRVVAVVVDAVRVPGDRAVAEVERVEERGDLAPRLVGARLGRHGLGGFLAGRYGGTVDRVEGVDGNGLAGLLDGVAH